MVKSYERHDTEIIKVGLSELKSQDMTPLWGQLKGFSESWFPFC